MAEAKSAALSAAAAPSLFVETVERVRPDIRLIGLPALGHLPIGVNLMVGLATGTRGVAVTVLGGLSDRRGIVTT